MDESTMLNLASFYDAIMKTNHECGFGSLKIYVNACKCMHLHIF